jgi:cytochrome b
MPEAERVWDPLVRTAHWTLAACVLGCLWLHEGGTAHEVLGYAALGVVLLRTGWGFAGPRRARFADFVRAPSEVLAYAGAAARHHEARHLGHNPLGGWMIVALLLCGAIAGASGALYVTDRFWGEAWLIRVHQVFSWSFALLVPLHVAGVVAASRRHRENLALAMLTGRKRAAGPGDID